MANVCNRVLPVLCGRIITVGLSRSLAPPLLLLKMLHYVVYAVGYDESDEPKITNELDMAGSVLLIFDLKVVNFCAF